MTNAHAIRDLYNSRRLMSNSTSVPQGVCKQWRRYLSHCVPGRNICDTDTELLIAKAGVAQWIEQWPVKQKAAGTITCLGCWPGPQLGASERQPIDVSLSHIDVCLPLFLPSFRSLQKKKKKERKKEKFKRKECPGLQLLSD